MMPRRIKRLLAAWIRRNRPQLVLLFGSAAGGPRGPESDIDLAVLFGRPVDRLQQVEQLCAALKNDTVDLLVLDHADAVARQAAAQGELVYARNAKAHLGFLSLAQRQFMDCRKFRRARRELTDEFLGGGSGS